MVLNLEKVSKLWYLVEIRNHIPDSINIRYKDNQPTFNADRNVFNFKDFNQQKEEERTGDMEM